MSDPIWFVSEGTSSTSASKGMIGPVLGVSILSSSTHSFFAVEVPEGAILFSF